MDKIIARRITTCDNIVDKIIDYIADSDYSINNKLPSDRDFADHFQVNRQTIYRAMSILAKRKIVKRKIGSGTILMVHPENLLADNPSLPGKAAGMFIGIICSQSTGGFFPEMITHYQNQAAAMNIKIQVHFLPDNSAETLRSQIYILSRNRAQAIVLSMPNLHIHAITLYELVKSGKFPPMIMTSLVPGLEQYHFNLGRHSSNTFNSGMLLACCYMQKLSYPRVAFFGPHSAANTQITARLVTYCKYTHDHGMEQLIAAIGPGENTRNLLRRWEKHPGVVGVIAYDDDYALMFLNAALHLGINIPGKFALLGFNDSMAGRLITPALTTIPFQYKYMAQAVLAACVSRIKNTAVTDFVPVVPQITVRESCGGRLKLGSDLESVLEQCRQEAQKYL